MTRPRIREGKKRMSGRRLIYPATSGRPPVTGPACLHASPRHRADRVECHGASPVRIHGGPKNGCLGGWNVSMMTARDVCCTPWLDATCASWNGRLWANGLSRRRRETCLAARDCLEGLKREAGSSRYRSSSLSPASMRSLAPWLPRSCPVEDRIAVRDETADGERRRGRRIRG